MQPLFGRFRAAFKHCGHQMHRSNRLHQYHGHHGCAGLGAEGAYNTRTTASFALKYPAIYDEPAVPSTPSRNANCPHKEELRSQD